MPTFFNSIPSTKTLQDLPFQLYLWNLSERVSYHVESANVILTVCINFAKRLSPGFWEIAIYLKKIIRIKLKPLLIKQEYIFTLLD